MMTEAEKLYERFVNYEWNEVSDSLKESILKAINEALKQGEKLTIPVISNSLSDLDGKTIAVKFKVSKIKPKIVLDTDLSE